MQFGFIEGETGVRIVALKNTLSLDCETDGEIEAAIEELHRDLDRLKGMMKQKLKVLPTKSDFGAIHP